MVVRDFGWRILGRIRRQEGIRDAAVILVIGIGAVVRAHWELDTLADATVADITLLLSLVATKVLCTIARGLAVSDVPVPLEPFHKGTRSPANRIVMSESGIQVKITS